MQSYFLKTEAVIRYRGVAERNEKRIWFLQMSACPNLITAVDSDVESEIFRKRRHKLVFLPSLGTVNTELSPAYNVGKRL